jgi:alkylation response protein AidB-like acyl-CoA dehydrogenase
LSGGSFDELNARLFCDLNDMVALYEMVSAAAIAGTAEDHDFSLLKLAASELFQRISEANLQIASDHAGVHGAAQIGARQLELHTIYMLARAATIYSGTSEVQRDIVARALLGKAG